MKLETFFEKFDEFADATNAVTKLRELVRYLAVTGKLILQDPNDEPAEGAVEKVRKDAKKAIRDGIIRRHGLEETIDDSNLPELPPGWRWTRLVEISLPVQYAIKRGPFGSSIRKDMFVSNGFKIYEQQHAISGDFTRGRYYINEAKFLELIAFELHPNEILVSCSGTVGKVAIVPMNIERGIINQALLKLSLHQSALLNEYFLILFPAFFMETDTLANLSGTAQKNIPGMEVLKAMPFPLPPLAEQRRIVVKVDELMGLCDRLETQQQERETRHAALARASLARFADAPTPANLSFIFHPSYTITPADLRKSILTLAVQGKLVPQDPNDEPASELLERLSRELSPENRRRQGAPLPPLPAESLQYELPECWTWARFRDVAIIASNLVNPNGFLDFTHLAPDNIEKGNGVLLPCATVREDKVISSNHRFYPGQIVYSKIRPNLAKVVVVDFEGLCSADMYPIAALIDAFFLHRYMLSESFLVQAVKTDTRVAMPKINQMELNAIAVPVPPLAEQRRIVAKVDQLMTLVDQLETQITASRAAADKLMEALVAELTAKE